MTPAPIKTDVDALAEALRLAITATTELKRDMALDLARKFAAGMTPRQVKKAKLIALQATQ